MFKNHFLCLLIILILSIFTVVFYTVNTKIKTQIGTLVDKLSRIDQYYKLMEFREKESIKNNGTILDSILTFTDENEKSIPLQQLTKQGYPKLIIRYSALACDQCIYAELQEINKYMAIIGKENIVILASDYNIRELKIWKESLPVDITVLRIEHTNILFEKENNSLFVFVLDKDSVVKDFFIPEKTLPRLSNNYYETVCNKYFKQ